MKDRALPILDLNSSPAEASKQLRAACEAHGFLYLVNHGIAADGRDHRVPCPDCNREVECGDDADRAQRMPLFIHTV